MVKADLVTHAHHLSFSLLSVPYEPTSTAGKFDMRTYIFHVWKKADLVTNAHHLSFSLLSVHYEPAYTATNFGK